MNDQTIQELLSGQVRIETKVDLLLAGHEQQEVRIRTMEGKLSWFSGAVKAMGAAGVAAGAIIGWVLDGLGVFGR